MVNLTSLSASKPPVMLSCNTVLTVSCLAVANVSFTVCIITLYTTTVSAFAKPQYFQSFDHVAPSMSVLPVR